MKEEDVRSTDSLVTKISPTTERYKQQILDEIELRETNRLKAKKVIELHAREMGWSTADLVQVLDALGL